MAWVAVGASVAGVAASSLLAPKQSGTQTVQQKMDPRMEAMLYGDGTDANKGLLSQYQSYLNNPQSAGTQAYGQSAQNWLGSNGANVNSQIQGAATNMMGSTQQAPQSQAAQSAGNGGRADILWNTGVGANAATVNAPSQNNVNLSGAYNNMINGDAGANPYLTKSLQAGVDATNAGYAKNVNTLTDQLQRTVLPGIRSNSVLAGQYGGTRQGIAEGNAISDYTRQLNDNNAQLAAQNSANTIGAQAQSFNQGQDRSLNAMNNLSGQQYGVASQNASMQQQANMQTAAQYQQANLQNQAIGNNMAQFDANQRQNNNQFNAGLNQQTNLANQSAQQQTDALNTQRQTTGMGALSGLLSNQYGAAQNQDNAGINRATQVNGLLAPYMGANGSTSSPIYQNTGANLLGGATAGLGLYNQLQQSGMFRASTPGGSGIGAPSITGVSGSYNMPDISGLLAYHG